MGNDANPSDKFTPPDFAHSCEEDISYMKASPDNKFLAVGYGCKKIRIFNIDNNTFVADFEGCCMTKMDSTRVSLDFSPDSKHLAYRWEKSIRFLDMESLQKVREINNECAPVTIAYSPNGNFILTGNNKDLIKVYDLNKDSSVSKIFEAKARTVTSMDKGWTHRTEPKWSPDG